MRRRKAHIVFAPDAVTPELYRDNRTSQRLFISLLMIALYLLGLLQGCAAGANQGHELHLICAQIVRTSTFS
jgi:hypothetical protein